MTGEAEFGADKGGAAEGGVEVAAWWVGGGDALGLEAVGEGFVLGAAAGEGADEVGEGSSKHASLRWRLPGGFDGETIGGMRGCRKWGVVGAGNWGRWLWIASLC